MFCKKKLKKYSPKVCISTKSNQGVVSHLEEHNEKTVNTHSTRKVPLFYHYILQKLNKLFLYAKRYVFTGQPALFN